jgi:hypothetical protein
MGDTREVNTLVFRGEFDKDKNPLVEPHCGLASSAWSRGNVIEEAGVLRDRVEMLEDFLQWAMEEGATELDFKLALEGAVRKMPTEAADVYFTNAENLPESVKKEVSLHSLKTIFDVMVKPAIGRVRALDRST